MRLVNRNARLFVVSGPSGAGKGTILSKVREFRPDLALTVSATTRKPRTGELDGVNYYYLSDAEFDQVVAEDGFLEWAHVFAHRYGTLRSEVERLLNEGHSTVLEIDVQGAQMVRERFEGAVLVFIAPPSLEVLEQRLRNRKTDDESQIELRLATAKQELELASHYDVVIVNDDLEQAAQELLAAIETYETN